MVTRLHAKPWNSPVAVRAERKKAAKEANAPSSTTFSSSCPLPFSTHCLPGVELSSPDNVPRCRIEKQSLSVACSLRDEWDSKTVIGRGLNDKFMSSSGDLNFTFFFWEASVAFDWRVSVVAGLEADSGKSTWGR